MQIPRSVFIATIIFTSGCADAPVAPTTCGTQPTQAQIDAEVKTYLASRNWKDPESVRFQNVRMQQCRAIWVGLLNGGRLTGWEIDVDVNAKNSYGGYTGFQTKQIIKTPDGKTIYLDDLL
jgi:hypothetical protein